MTTPVPLKLVCQPKKWISIPEQGKHYSVDLNLHVVDEQTGVASAFEMMCEAIVSDIHNKAYGAPTLYAITRVESGADFIEIGGDAWTMHLTPQVVWFEGTYGQGEGGAVTLRQFKLAVETYIEWLDDPQHRPIEVAFPDDPQPTIPDVSSIVESRRQEAMERARFERLNSRELEVLQAIEQGGSDDDIARRLSMRVNRLVQYRQEMLEKTKTSSIAELSELVKQVRARPAN